MARNQLFARKSLEVLLKEMEGENRLRRALGPISLTSLGVGAIIGAGIFVMTGRAAAQDAGPGVVLSYLVAGLGCLMAALCYAELAAMVPVAGSAYTYTYTTLGEIFAWIIGWDLVLEYAMGCATVASGWSGYFDKFLQSVFHAQFPPRLLTDPFSTVTLADGSTAYGIFNLPAVAIMALVTVVLVVGIRESAMANNVLVMIKVAVVLFVIAVGIRYVRNENWFGIPVTQRISQGNPTEKWGMLGLVGLNRWLVPIDEASRTPFTPYGFSGVMLGAAIVFFAFIGFDSISTHAEEAIHPQRDLPIGILASLSICTVLYIAVSAVITGMVPYPQIDEKAAVAAAFLDLAHQQSSGYLRFASALISTGAIAGLTSVLLVTFLSQARVFLAMARDGLLPPSIFGAIHPRFRTPHRSTLLTGVLVCLAAALTPIGELEQMVNIGTLMAFVMVCAAVMMLRKSRPDARRPFRCPAVFVVASLGIFINFTMTLFLKWETWLRLVVWLAIGLVIYFSYGRRHSTLARSLEQEIVRPGAAPTGTPLDPPAVE